MLLNLLDVPAYDPNAPVTAAGGGCFLGFFVSLFFRC